MRLVMIIIITIGIVVGSIFRFVLFTIILLSRDWLQLGYVLGIGFGGCPGLFSSDQVMG
jgi:hypothetical protein